MKYFDTESLCKYIILLATSLATNKVGINEVKNIHKTGEFNFSVHIPRWYK